MTVFKFIPHLQNDDGEPVKCWILLIAFSLADKHTSDAGGVFTCIKMSGIFWFTQLWHSTELARNVMLCMRKEHLLWGYRYCLVLTTSAETNCDNDHALLCMNNCTFHAFMGGWEKKRMIISWVRETSTHVFCRNYEHQAHGLCAHTGPRYNRDN